MRWDGDGEGAFVGGSERGWVGGSTEVGFSFLPVIGEEGGKSGREAKDNKGELDSCRMQEQKTRTRRRRRCELRCDNSRQAAAKARDLKS